MKVNLYTTYSYDGKPIGHRVIIFVHLFGRVFWSKVFESNKYGFTVCRLEPDHNLRDVS